MSNGGRHSNFATNSYFFVPVTLPAIEANAGVPVGMCPQVVSLRELLVTETDTSVVLSRSWIPFFLQLVLAITIQLIILFALSRFGMESRLLLLLSASFGVFTIGVLPLIEILARIPWRNGIRIATKADNCVQVSNGLSSVTVRYCGIGIASGRRTLDRYLNVGVSDYTVSTVFIEGLDNEGIKVVVPIITGGCKFESIQRYLQCRLG